ncbi:MAG: hypothetical protein H7Y20_06960 [Bryobacteraceae bacterium]|nr:hypothetical protein [Bryobacteraceae bacterium]
MKLIAILLFAGAVCQAAEGSAAAYAKALQTTGLDPDACYRVRDLAFQKDDVRFFLTEGHLIFSKPLEGRRFAAMFTSDVPGGDAEILLFPPSRSERSSLAQFTKSPNLNEHFSAGLFLFTDGTGEELIKQIESQNPKKLPEIGLSLAAQFSPTLSNMAASYEIRLVQDHFSEASAETGFLYAALRGKQLGNFDVLIDNRNRDQIMVGQVVERQNRRFFDTWTSFPLRRLRTGRQPQAPSKVELSNIRIEATLSPPDLGMKATTAMDLASTVDGQSVLPFEISSLVRVLEVKFDGQPVEVFARESMRADLVRKSGNTLFLVLLPKPLEKGVRHRLEFSHEGNVVMSAGNGVYFVGSRMNWYPARDAEFALYDMTFRYPKNLNLVATGELVSEKVEGEWRVAHHVTSSPIRFAGFNLGEYQTSTSTRAGVTIRVCANRSVESALQPRREVTVPPLSPRGVRRSDSLQFPVGPMAAPNPGSRLDAMNLEIGDALEFMASHFGPPPLKTLSVSPIPGTFGQGFPGLLYLSTLAYLNASDLAIPVQTDSQRRFFTELLYAHETAHQWWGNLVTSPHYQDDWLMEALANYSALMVLEKRKGRRALESVLDEYRQNLLRKTEGDRNVDSAGPIVWGIRLNSSQGASAWRTIVYEKGAWIIHMLRERLGDERFLKALGEVTRRKRYDSVSAEEFRSILSEFLPPKTDDPKLDNFFDTWVRDTGIPSLKMTWNVQGKAPKVKLRGTITQSDVGDDFSASVPVDVQLPGKRAYRHWVRTSSESTSFSIDLAQTPLKVMLDSSNAVLARK